MLRLSAILQCFLVAAGQFATVARAQTTISTTTAELEEARTGYEATLASNPDDLSAQAGEVQISERIALEARAAGDTNFALKALLRAQSFALNNARIYYDLGVLEDEMHLFLDADKALGQAAALGLEDPNLLYAAGRVKLDLGQLDAAEEKITAYLLERPDDASAHYALGRVYRQGIKFDQAAAEFRRCIQLQPKQTEGYYQLGETELAQGKFAEAIGNFATTLQRNPKHAGALAGTGIAYYKQGRYDLAEAPLRQAVETDGTYQQAHYYLGLVLGRLDRKAESQTELTEAARLAAIEGREAAGRLRINATQDIPAVQ